jgi:hypothetical protein
MRKTRNRRHTSSIPFDMNTDTPFLAGGPKNFLILLKKTMKVSVAGISGDALRSLATLRGIFETGFGAGRDGPWHVFRRCHHDSNCIQKALPNLR